MYNSMNGMRGFLQFHLYRTDSYQNILIHYLLIQLTMRYQKSQKRPNHQLVIHFQNLLRNLPCCLMDKGTFLLLHLQSPKLSHHMFFVEFQLQSRDIVLNPSCETLPMSQIRPLQQMAHMLKFQQWQQELYPPWYKHHGPQLSIDYRQIPVMGLHQTVLHLKQELSILQHWDSIDDHQVLLGFLECSLNYLSKKGMPMQTPGPTFHYYSPNRMEYCNLSHCTLHQIGPLSLQTYQQNFDQGKYLLDRLHNRLFHMHPHNFFDHLQNSFDHLLRKEFLEP